MNQAKAEAEKIKEEFKTHAKVDRWGDTDAHATKCAIIHVRGLIAYENILVEEIGADSDGYTPKHWQSILTELEGMK